MCAPLCLFHFDTTIGTIVPVAIQLKPNGKIYYARAHDDSEPERHEWLLAKIFVNNAGPQEHTDVCASTFLTGVRRLDCQVHQISTHLTRTHLIIEAMALATRRCFSPAHPLFRLLKSHLM